MLGRAPFTSWVGIYRTITDIVDEAPSMMILQRFCPPHGRGVLDCAPGRVSLNVRCSCSLLRNLAAPGEPGSCPTCALSCRAHPNIVRKIIDHWEGRQVERTITIITIPCRDHETEQP